MPATRSRSAALLQFLVTPTGEPNAVARAADGVAAVWVAVTAVNVAVWLLVCVTSFSLVYPWFVWPLVIGGLAVAALRLAATGRRRVHGDW